MPVTSLVRSASDYFVPCKPRITIQSRDGSDTYFTYNAFLNTPSPQGLKVVYVDAEKAAFETGTFNLVIEDSHGLIAKDRLSHMRVLLEFGKDQDHFIPFMAGFSDHYEINRPQNFYMEHKLSGPSTKSNLSNVFLLVRRGTDKKRNPDYAVGQLIIDIIRKRKSRPLNRNDFEEVFGIATDMVSNGGRIDDDVNETFYSRVNEVFTTLWDFIERMSALTGASWDLEYENDPSGTFAEIFSMKYPGKRHTGVRIKSIDLAASNDNRKKTSYLIGPFTVTEDSTLDAGVATTVYTVTQIDQQVINSQNTTGGFSDLSNKALAQQVIILNDQRRITDLMFILSKIGNPESPKNRVNGDIVMDDSANRPLGQTICTFNIPLDDIKTSPRSIFVNDVDVKVRFLEGTNKVWLRLFQRSGTKGNPNTDNLNTIRWHHNNFFQAGQPVYNAVAPGGDYSTKATLNWGTPLNSGPVFCYSLFSRINKLVARTNPVMEKRIGIKEQFIDTSFLGGSTEEKQAFLSVYLNKVSKARMSVSNIQCTIPNQYLFQPYQIVSFEDSLSNTFADLEVQRARITVSALSGDNSGIGAYFMELSLGGAVNPLVGNCSCS